MGENDQMLEVFLFEMTSMLDQLDGVLLDSESEQALSDDHVNEIFRIMHTIKGSSAMMEFNVISTVTHRLEDTFYYIRENGIEQQHFTELFDLMLDASDFLGSQLEAIQNGETLAEGNDELVERVDHLLKALDGQGDTQPKEPATSAPPSSDSSAADSDNPGVQTFHVDVLFEEDCGMENLRAFMLINTLQKNCNILRYHPEDIETNSESSSEILVNGFSIVLQTSLPQEKLQTTVEDAMHVKSAIITPIDESESALEEPTPALEGDHYEVLVRFEEDSGMENLRAFMLVNFLQRECNILGYQPDNIETDPGTAREIKENGFIIQLETPLAKQDLKTLIDGAIHVKHAVLTPVHATRNTASPKKAAAASDAAKKKNTPAVEPKKAAATSGKPVKQNLITVSLSKLDELMDLMGELVITESMVIHSPDLEGLDNDMDNFSKSARQLLKLTDELQDMVMSIRMIPVSATFQRMRRIVRDMCRNFGKDAQLVTMGEETDIDKTIIDGIADPIMHLVRNAMDHGVESPEERAAAGKDPTATITLSAQNTGGEILITVSDDGKGLDAQALLEKGQKNGILTKPASEYSDKEAFMLLCAPGFSTKSQVTEYSGRGVGMDVVKKNIEKIGGTVVIESKKGFGMSVFLKIPLTLAIVDGMDISVGDSIYTLQITSINESFKVTNDQMIVDTNGNEMIMIRGQVFPVIRLHELYAIPDAVTELEEGILIWVEAGGKSACLFADQLIGEQQIVVKPLPIYLKRYDVKSFGISGCTILGNGSISLILDVGDIIEKAMRSQK